MYGNVRQCQHFRYPARYPSWVPNKTADDCTANRPSCRQWSRAGGSVFLIITPVHAHRNVQQLRRHIRRNPRRHAPIRRNVRPRTLQTAPSLHNAEQGLNGPSLRETPPTNQTTETVKSRIISLEILLHAQRQIIMRQGRSAKTVPVYISVFIHQRHAVTGQMLFDPFR